MKLTKRKLNKLTTQVFIILLSCLVITRLLFEGSGNGGLWNYLQVFFVISGFVFTFLNYKSNRQIVFCAKIFGVFSLYIWFLSTFALKEQSYEAFYYFLVVPYGYMIFTNFYNLGLKTDFINVKTIIVLTFIIVSALFLHGRITVIKGITTETDMVINSYYPMVLLPLVLAYVKRNYGIIFFSIVILLIILSGKRAGLLAITIMLIAYYFQISLKNFTKSIRNITIIAILLFVSYSVNNTFKRVYDIDIIDRLERVVEDGGSGRNAIWLNLTNKISNASLLNFVFGNGLGSTSKDIGINAHNDFLQVFYEFGVIAFIMYIIFYFSMIKEYFQMVKYKYPYAKNFAISIIAALFLSLFSYFIIEPRIISFSALSWGLFLADWLKFQRNYKISTNIN